MLIVWPVKPNNTGALFAIMTIIGVTSLTLLAVGLELGADLTRNADASSAILWFMCVCCSRVSMSVNGILQGELDRNYFCVGYALKHNHSYHNLRQIY